MIFIFSKLLLHSTRNFYIEQFVKFVFSHMRYIFNNLRFVFHKMKFIKLKSYTFSKPNLYVTSYTSNRIWQNEISVLWVVHPVCKYFLTLFERWCFEVEFSFFYYPIVQWTYAKNWDWGGCLVTSMWMSTRFCLNMTMTCTYFFSWGLQQNVLLVFLLLVLQVLLSFIEG